MTLIFENVPSKDFPHHVQRFRTISKKLFVTVAFCSGRIQALLVIRCALSYNKNQCRAEKEWLKVAKEYRRVDRCFHVMETNYRRKRGKSLIGVSSVTVTGEFVVKSHPRRPRGCTLVYLKGRRRKPHRVRRRQSSPDGSLH